MPYTNDNGISPWYNVNETGEPLDRWVDDLAVVLDHAGPHAYICPAPRPARRSTYALLCVMRSEKRVKNMIIYPGISSSPEGRRMFPHFREITETFRDEALGRLTQ